MTNKLRSTNRCGLRLTQRKDIGSEKNEIIHGQIEQVRYFTNRNRKMGGKDLEILMFLRHMFRHIHIFHGSRLLLVVVSANLNDRTRKTTCSVSNILRNDQKGNERTPRYFLFINFKIIKTFMLFYRHAYD